MGAWEHDSMGDLPADVADLLTASRLLALTKPGGGTRPIAIGETIYRLAGKAALYSSAEPARNHFLPLQFGVAVMGGGEAIIHGARAFASELPESLIAQVDLANAGKKHVVDVDEDVEGGGGVAGLVDRVVAREELDPKYPFALDHVVVERAGYVDEGVEVDVEEGAVER
ncbi:hypothetical protein CLOM_g23792 [Closterium sp. NIES-68]|nr:hypothetical protein CLOM_g23792 [Closterium sp. NIES-68]